MRCQRVLTQYRQRRFCLARTSSPISQIGRHGYSSHPHTEHSFHNLQDEAHEHNGFVGAIQTVPADTKEKNHQSGIARTIADTVAGNDQPTSSSSLDKDLSRNVQRQGDRLPHLQLHQTSFRNGLPATTGSPTSGRDKIELSNESWTSDNGEDLEQQDAAMQQDVEYLLQASHTGSGQGAPTTGSTDVEAPEERVQQEPQSEQEWNSPRTGRTTNSAKRDSTSEVYPFTLGRATLIHMTQTLRKVRELGLPDKLSPSLEKSTSHVRLPFRKRTKHYLDLRSVFLKEKLEARESDPEYRRLYDERRKLPIQRKEIVQQLKSLLETNDVVVVVSATGSGKTTQLPQLILDWRTSGGDGAYCNIICTQPRRLAAVSVARRVAQEQRTTIGKHVGSSVRFAKNPPSEVGGIGYWTAGVLLKALYDEPDNIMSGYSHLIVDEVHERDVTTDLVLTTLRDTLRARLQARQKCPRIILMSATIDALDFQRYFAEPFPKGRLRVNTLEVPGRNFGVQVHTLDEFVPEFEQYSDDGKFVALFQGDKDYLASEDAFADMWGSKDTVQDQAALQVTEVQRVPVELTAATIAHVLNSSEDGDILVFLPGIGEIERVKTCLQNHPILGLDFNDEGRIRLYKLHASLWETNDQVFEPVPEGCRRVVLSTNIAQTSVTLPDVVHVIDAGLQRRMTYIPSTQVNEFRCHWIDRSSSTQRKGRTGRTKPGHYWTIFTRARLESLRPKALPEIQTMDLTAACLAIKSQTGSKESVKDALARCMDPPDLSLIEIAVEELKKLRMLDDNESITPLGKFAAWFPLAPATARALLLGVLFRCLEPILIMASHSMDKPLVQNGSSLSSQLQSNIHFARMKDDDRAAFVSAFQSYSSATHRAATDELTELQQHNVKQTAYHEMLNVSRQICDLLSAHNILPVSENDGESIFRQLPPHLSENASSGALVKSLALSMQHSNLGVYNQRYASYYVKHTPVFVQPFSVNGKEASRISDRTFCQRNGKLISYSLLLNLPSDSKALMSQTSTITPLMAMLFGGPVEVIDTNIVQINGWLKYRVNVQGSHESSSVDDSHAVDLIFEFRKTLDRIIQIACANLQSKYDIDTSPNLDEDTIEPLKSPLSPGNALIETFTQGLRAVVESDANLWDEYVLVADETTQQTKRKGRA